MPRRIPKSQNYPKIFGFKLTFGAILITAIILLLASNQPQPVETAQQPLPSPTPCLAFDNYVNIIKAAWTEEQQLTVKNNLPAKYSWRNQPGASLVSHPADRSMTLDIPNRVPEAVARVFETETVPGLIAENFIKNNPNSSGLYVSPTTDSLVESFGFNHNGERYTAYVARDGNLNQELVKIELTCGVE